jgi:hypothetical protein
VIFVGSDQIYLSGPKSGPDKWPNPLVSLNLLIKLGENGALAVLKPDQVEKLLKGQHAPDLSVTKLLNAPSLI